MISYRTEKDSLGELNVPENAYWGVHTQRAIENFAISEYKVSQRLIQALAMVKLACLEANHELNYLSDDVYSPSKQACEAIISGQHSDQFPTDALQGGAGTSTNMNLNEVIANKALELSGKELGDYSAIHPIEHINLHQSTNDVYPTALKIACIYGYRELSKSVEELQGALQQKEKEFAEILTIGRTEYQDAVPITLGSQFSSFAEAIARDRWRTFKCEERLRTVNIGGTAVGTGMTAPRQYIFLVIEKLRAITNLGLMRAEQVMDSTANADVYAEVGGMLSANAVNLIKISNDLRILHYLNEITLAPRQTGSSIMPGKINPVIIEATISTGMKVKSNMALVNDCIGSGTLQINEFLPLIAHSMLESLDLLININRILAEHIKEVRANPEVCKEHFEKNESIITAFVPSLGYARCEELIYEYKTNEHSNLRDFLNNKLGDALVAKVLSPFSLMSLGYKE